MPKFISFCFYLFSSTSGAYCGEDITKIDNELISCKKNQLLFGYLKFESNISNFQYIHEKSLKCKNNFRLSSENFKFYSELL